MYMRYFGILQEVKYNSNTRINRIPRYVDKHNEEIIYYTETLTY